MSAELDGLARMARVEPPAELDVLVRGRCGAALLARRGDARRLTSVRGGTPRARVAVAVSLAERGAYVLGLLACGAQASGFAAHWVWHALTSGR